MRDLTQLMPIFNFIEDIYRKNSASDTKYYKICQYYGNISARTVQIMYTLYFYSILLMGASGAYESYCSGELKPTLLIYLPGIDDRSTCYMLLLVIFNYAIAVMSLISSPLNDALFFVLFANIPMIPKIIEGQLNELNERQEDRMVSRKEIRSRMWQYFLMHSAYNG